MKEELNQELNEQEKLQNEPKLPRRYNLYEQMNINEEYLDLFIMGMFIITIAVIFFALL